jgi:acyl-coenzyme A synthetase/AMP-(fatty) acid ligase
VLSKPPKTRHFTSYEVTSLHVLATLPGHVLTAASTTARSTGTGPSSQLAKPPIKHRDCRALKHREQAYKVVFVREIARTANGKVSRKTLPQLVHGASFMTTPD